jgi:hypothetical protein
LRVRIIVAKGFYFVRVPEGKEPGHAFMFYTLAQARAFCRACDFAWSVTA